MKFSCEKALLQSAVSVASRTVSPKSAISALEGILITADRELKLTGFNLSTGIRTTVPADIRQEGSIVISSHLFGDLVRRLPDDVVEITTNEKNMINIKCGRSEFNLLGTDAEDFPELPMVDFSNTVEIRRSTLRSMISQTSFAVSTNEARPIHTGSLFEVELDCTVTVVSVDGYRLALRREKADSITGLEKFSFVVPAAALNEVEKICGDSEETMKIVIGNKHVMFKAGDTMLVSRRLYGDFLDYRKVLPDSFKITMVADKKILLNTIDRVSLIITDKQKSPIRCTFTKDKMDIRVNTALGDASDDCGMTGEVSNLEIGFNNKYMLDALKYAPAESVTLCMNSAVAPCIITPSEADREDFLYMVLPVRLRAGQ